MTGLTPEGIEIDRDIAAPSSRVFEAFTTAGDFAAWFGGDQVAVPAETLDFVAEPGRAWRATMVLPDGNTIAWTGEFREVTPHTRVVFTLTDQPQDPARAEVRVELTTFGGGTRVHLEQDTPGFPDEAKRATIAGYEGFLDALQRLVTA
jgi:uncharacterized protein YndB with AHSA1/START domain